MHLPLYDAAIVVCSVNWKACCRLHPPKYGSLIMLLLLERKMVMSERATQRVKTFPLSEVVSKHVMSLAMIIVFNLLPFGLKIEVSVLVSAWFLS